MNFLPTDPIAIAATAIVFVVAALLLLRGDAGQRVLAFIFVLSCVTINLAVATETLPYLLVGYPLCATLCLFMRSTIIRVIGAIYGLKLLVLPVVGLSVSDAINFWTLVRELNLFFLALQTILAIGTFRDGGIGRICALLADGSRHRRCVDNLSLVQRRKKH